ncbi:MAG: hypothetical protein GXO64_03725, partial [Candidatus Micrarchaeota archaeon]|nr:hypothetical protein [Candidatus Micrarchaeota archaeon]
MKKIFTGFFNNWDSIVNLSDINMGSWDKKYEYLKKALSSEDDNETIISEDEFTFLDGLIKKKRTIPGGNGLNASIGLAKAGIRPIMSCPSRTIGMLSELSSNNILITEGNNIISPEKAKANDTCPEHIIIEDGSARHIFTYDPISLDFRIDYDFISNLRRADLLWISGFHLASEN